MNPSLLIFATSYAIANKLFQSPTILVLLDKHSYFKIISKIISIILALLIILLTIVLLLPFGVFKLVTYCYLRKRHGENFGGFLNGVSTGFAIQKEQTEIIGLHFAEYDDRPDEFYKTFRLCVEKTHNDFHPMGNAIEKFCGYYYFIKNQFTVDDVISTVTINNNETLTIDEALDYFDSLCVSSDKRLWRAILLDQPVWINNKKTYGVVIKLNHAIADGFNAISMTRKYFIVPQNQPTNDSKIDFKKYEKPFTLDNCYMYKHCFVYHDDKLKESGKQYTSYYLEEQPNIANKIPIIAKKYNVRYSDVVVAGLIEGISSLLDKKNVQFSGKFQLVTTASADAKQIKNMLNEEFKIETLANAFLSIPAVITKNQRGSSRSSLLLDIAKECELVKRSMNPWITYTLLKYVVSILPTWLYEKPALELSKKSSLIFSNVVALGKSTFCDRNMEAILAAVTIATNKTIFATTYTFLNRFAMAISGRFDFIENRMDIEYIMNEAVRYIDGLFEDLTQEKLQ